MDLSVIVPCYNESANLPRLIQAFQNAFDKVPYAIELVLVDNGSTDATNEVLKEEVRRSDLDFVSPVRIDVNQGYGHGILTGLRQASGEILAWSHADMQTPPEDTVRAFEMIRDTTDPRMSMVRGLRTQRPFVDEFFTRAMGYFASAALACRLFDVNAQPKVFHSSFLPLLDTAPNDFTLDLYALYQAKQIGMDVQTFEVRFDARTAGEAKGGGTLKGKYKLTKRTISQIVRLRKTLKSRPSTTTESNRTQEARRAA